MKYDSIVVSAHQPNFIPYLGFFDKMQKSNIFVIRDEVLYVKKEFHNRNRIRINSNKPDKPQSKWINVPVKDPKDYILHATINKNCKLKSLPWEERILRDIKVNYEKAPYFKKFFPKIEKIFDDNYDDLLSLNMKIIKFLSEFFKIKTKIVMASDLDLKPKNYEKSDASRDLAKICEVLNADVYLSGSGGKGYLDLEPFNKNKIKVDFQEYEHPVYSQVFPGFLPYMSAIDALFCCGEMPLNSNN